jgi:hypothetical protein
MLNKLNGLLCGFVRLVSYKDNQWVFLTQKEKLLGVQILWS